MADEQDTNEGGVPDYDGNDGNDGNDIIETTTVPLPVINDGKNTFVEEYPDEETLPDVTVNLIIDEQPVGAVTDIVNAGIIDGYGDSVTTTPWSESIDRYTTAITEGINGGLEGNGTTIGGKQWWSSWTWHKGFIVGLIALCIIGIILALLFLIRGKKNQRKSKSANVPVSGTTKSVVSKGISPNPEYSSVPTSV